MSITARLNLIMLESLVLLVTNLAVALVFTVLTDIFVHQMCIILLCVLWLYCMVQLLLLRILFMLNIVLLLVWLLRQLFLFLSFAFEAQNFFVIDLVGWGPEVCWIIQWISVLHIVSARHKLIFQDPSVFNLTQDIGK